MSEQKTQKGKIKEIDLQGKTIEDWCKEYCLEHNMTNKHVNESWKEYLFDARWEEFFIVKDRLFQIIEIKELDNSYYTQIDKLEDNTYSFYSTYYNGGTCLQECLEDELENIL